MKILKSVIEVVDWGYLAWKQLILMANDSHSLLKILCFSYLANLILTTNVNPFKPHNNYMKYMSSSSF